MNGFDWSLYRGNLSWLPERTIYVSRHGSHAYGTSLPTSDLDLRGICIAPREYYLGFNKVFEQAESKDPDLTIFELRKFLKLAADCNPNVVEILFTDPTVRQAIQDDFSRRLVEITGWAWPNVNAKTWESAASVVGYDENFIRLLDLERQYGARLKEWQNYQVWKRTRNQARAELEAKSGYDTKHGMHLVRLMRMCREILDGRGVVVRRPDAEELIEIRSGAWPYDKLIEWAERQDAELEVLAKTSKLPRQVDRNAIDALCVSIIDDWV